MDTLTFIGHVHSPLKDLNDCPRQENEGAPSVTLNIFPEYREALSGLHAGASIIVLTWLHRANRATLSTHPRNNPDAPLTGVFATRSPDRPNPIGMHTTTITSISEDGVLTLAHLEVLDGTPVVDIKPVW
jgi:tRNA-Thr(GGU) m(6)t(6)A37 methyltransferase TsaA